MVPHLEQASTETCPSDGENENWKKHGRKTSNLESRYKTPEQS